MPNTYSQLYIQIVFAVKYRQSLIHESFREQLQKYICGIAEKRNAKIYAVYCMPDHVHIFVSIKPSVSISDLVRDIKRASSMFINEQRWLRGQFQWQEGFGAFSYSNSHINNVVNYIHNQKEHHVRKKFREEYIELLEEYEINYMNEYLFEEPE